MFQKFQISSLKIVINLIYPGHAVVGWDHSRLHKDEGCKQGRAALLGPLSVTSLTNLLTSNDVREVFTEAAAAPVFDNPRMTALVTCKSCKNKEIPSIKEYFKNDCVSEGLETMIVKMSGKFQMPEKS